MPEGSSSAAPVMRPGPRSAKNPRRRTGRKVAADRSPRAPFLKPCLSRVFSPTLFVVQLDGGPSTIVAGTQGLDYKPGTRILVQEQRTARLRVPTLRLRA